MRLLRRWKRRPREFWIGWAAIVVGVLAVYVALPPLLIRTPIPSISLGVVGVFMGLLAARNGAIKLGFAAVAIAIAGAVGGVAATRSGTSNLETVFAWSVLVAAMLRFATPLVFAAIGGVLSERSGVINIGLEGMMLVGAFFAIWGADFTNSWIAGLLIGMAAGGVFGLLHATFAVSLRADQIVAGTAINLLALGVTGYMFVDIYGENGTPEGIPGVPDISLPLGWIPVIGNGIKELNLLVWLALGFVVVGTVLLFRSTLGLRLRSVGENPLASDTAGISVARVRYLAVTASGAVAALGGAFLSIGFVHSFSQNMTAGRGFIALAAVIFGKWRPSGALAAALLFGLSSALAQRLPTFSPSAATLFQALPYVLTLIAVAGLVGRSRPPAAIGVPYSRG